MNSPPLIAALDWDSVLYFLIPLAWVAFQFLGGKKQDEEQEGGAGDGTPSEKAERMRRVQEEIRRRIAERQEEMRQEREGGPIRPIAPAEPQPAQSMPQPAPHRTRTLRQPSRTAAPPPVPAAQSGGASGDDIAVRLKAQRRQVEEARKAREAALAKAQKIRAGAHSDVTVGGAADSRSLRGEVLGALSSPLAARRAIVLSEILGEPRANKPYQA